MANSEGEYGPDKRPSPIWFAGTHELSGPSLDADSNQIDDVSILMRQLSPHTPKYDDDGLKELFQQQEQERDGEYLERSPVGKGSPVRFDSTTKSKFYNSLLRNPAPGVVSPIRKGDEPGSPGKRGKLRSALHFAASADELPVDMESPDKLANSVSDDREEPSVLQQEPEAKGGKGKKMIGLMNRLPTPILLPDIKTHKERGNPLSGINLELKTLTTEQLKAKDTTFMNSTFHDGNSNISQRRHKYDFTQKQRGKPGGAKGGGVSVLGDENSDGEGEVSIGALRGSMTTNGFQRALRVSSAGGITTSKAATKRPKKMKNFSSDQSVESSHGAMHDGASVDSDSSIMTPGHDHALGLGLGLGRPGESYDIGPVDRESRDISSESYARRQRSAMADMTRSIDMQSASASNELRATRDSLLRDADDMVSKLPMRYLWNKRSLRPYAMARIYGAVSKMTIYKIQVALRRAMTIWREPPEVKMTEIQVGFMVIAKRFENMWRNALKVKFEMWAFRFSSRFQKRREALPDKAAREIQLWWRDIRVTSKDPFKWLFSAVQICLQRRRAIKHMIEFELARRNAQPKMFRVIMKRRRDYYASRSIMRPYAWFKLYRKTQMRLTRLKNVRTIQRFYRMRLARPEKEHRWIKAILRYGGYSKVLPKMPPRFVRGGFLQSLDMVAGVIQRAWYTSKGNYAAFIVAAARRAKEEHLQMLNDNATIIQHNFRGHLWNLLNIAAVQHNRARRISFAFRHYQYRIWATTMLIPRPHRYIRKIQRCVRKWLERRFLVYRFKARKAFMLVFRRRQLEGAVAIQREYRAYRERERIKKEAFIALVKMQRQQSDLVMKNIRTIQKAWRKHLKVNAFPRHIYLIAWRHVRKERRILYEKAIIIQKIARPHILRVIERRKARLMAAVGTIWVLAKSYVLKLAVWDRIMATRKIQKAASTKIGRFYRKILFRSHIELRRRLRVIQKKYVVFINNAATKVQRWIKRKWIEYYLPLRVTARANFKKKQFEEVARVKAQRRQRAALTITRLFIPWAGRWVNKSIVEPGDPKGVWIGSNHGWMKRTLVRIAKEKRYYTERKASKKMQKFCKKVVAWARFDRVAAYRKAAIIDHSKWPALQNAANVIGTYWYRSKEKFALQMRFKERRLVLDEYARLEALKLEAYEARDEALEAKRITDENLQNTINASWKQGSDITGRNYFYNYVTGETTWEAPEHWKAPVMDTWIRQKDDKANIYYYNMYTGESSWLPPCVVCGDQAERYCGNCEVAYCENHYEELHGDDAEDEDYKTHVWALVEYEKEELKKGEQYCLECKKRSAAVTCLECWDSYCKECFKYTHAAGHLKYHRTMSYHKAKKGWMCVKATSVDDSDYYVNGETGVTTYEKPIELMSVDEKMYYDQFVEHRDQMQEFIDQIKTLQHDLEDASYERDLIFQRALEHGTQMADVLARRKAKKKASESLFSAKDDGKDTITEVAKKIEPGMFGGITEAFAEYSRSLLAPQGRKRGAEKSDYMKSLLDKVEIEKAEKARADK